MVAIQTDKTATTNNTEDQKSAATNSAAGKTSAETKEESDRTRRNDAPISRGYSSSTIPVNDSTRGTNEQNHNHSDDRSSGGAPFSGLVLQPHGPILSPDQRILEEERLARLSLNTVDTARRSMAEMRELLSRTEGLIAMVISGGEAASLLSRVQSLLASAPVTVTPPASSQRSVNSGLSSEEVEHRCHRTLSACENERDQLERRGPDSSGIYGRIAAERATSVLVCVEDLNRGLSALEERLASSSLITTDFNALHYLDALRSVKRQLQEVETSMRDMQRLGHERSISRIGEVQSIAA
ncbi:MAG: hypothetical protein QY326_01175 [Bdellovibrionota bacterium]|nr:MAG: hypothetical protein QY326_01175 [Bdellovibrionota bacterium]